VTGGVACCLIGIPVVGAILAIVLGNIAVRKARRGQAAVEASNGQLRGKGAYIAGKIMGWCGVGLGAFFVVFWLVYGIVIAAVLR
jgi:hypothetical protein